MPLRTREQAARQRAVDLRRRLWQAAEERRWHSMNNLEPPAGDDLADVLESVAEEHHQAVRDAVAAAASVDWDASGRRPRIEKLSEVASAAAAGMSDPARPGDDLSDDPAELAEAVYDRMYG